MMRPRGNENIEYNKPSHPNLGSNELNPIFSEFLKFLVCYRVKLGHHVPKCT